MTERTAVRVLDAVDSGWDTLVAEFDMDPYCTRAFARCEAGPDGRAVLIHVQGADWACTEVIVLAPAGEDDVTARSPQYGGPWLQGRAVDDPSVASEARAAVDTALRDLGAISQVSVLSPWAPAGRGVNAWHPRPTRRVCIATLTDLDRRWTRLGSTRRSEVRRVERDGELSWDRFSAAQAHGFAQRYVVAMEARQAETRWRHDGEYFAALSVALEGRIHVMKAQAGDGGAAAVFFQHEARAAYLYAVRWGTAGGVATAALWGGQRELAALGVSEVLLGGGSTDAPDDTLLHFKRSMADREMELMVAGRVFDPDAVNRHVDAGMMRPPPPWSVAPAKG